MIELNLLPKELRKRKKKLLPEIPILPIGASVLVALIACNYFLSAVLKNKEGAVLAAKKEWEVLEPRQKDAEKLGKDVEAIQKRLAAMELVTKPDLRWARLLSGLNNAVIPNVWLSVFESVQGGAGQRNTGASGRAIYLEGYALGKAEATSTVGKFIDSLKANPEFADYFDEIKLENMMNKVVSGEEVMEFKLICRFKDSVKI
jgi:Tfp pilus assembly protein PilN